MVPFSSASDANHPFWDEQNSFLGPAEAPITPAIAPDAKVMLLPLLEVRRDAEEPEYEA